MLLLTEIRHWAVGYAVLFCGMCFMYADWNMEVRERFQHRIDVCRQIGLPVEPADFQRQTPPEADNAALALIQIADSLEIQDINGLSIDELLRDHNLFVEHLEEIGEFLEQNSAALERIPAALRKPRVLWPYVLSSPVTEIQLPYLKGQRDISRLIAANALYKQHFGDDAAAARLLADGVRHADLLSTNNIFIISYFVAIWSQVVQTQAVEALLADQSSTETGNGKCVLDHEIGRELIALLLDDDVLRTGWREALRAEHLNAMDLGKHYMKNPEIVLDGDAWFIVCARASVRLFPEFVYDDLILSSKFHESAWRAGENTTYEESVAQCLTLTGDEDLWFKLKHLFTEITIWDFDRAFRVQYRAIALRRMAAVAIAIRLYEQEHGIRPPTLSVLVPAYLPSVPVDPFPSQRRPIGYLPDAPEPRLYCVYQDGIDDAGCYQFDERGRVDRKSDDLVFFLNGKPIIPLDE